VTRLAFRIGRRSPRLLVALAGLAAVGATATLAGAAPAPVTLSGLTAWATAGSRIGFVATGAGGRRGYLWVESFGSNRPRRLRAGPPVQEEQTDQLAPGPKGSWGCLEQTVGNTESYYSVDLVSSSGRATHVATAGGATGANGDRPVGSIPLLVGDGRFLGYLYVTPAGAVQLFRITAAGHRKRIAALVGVTAPQEVAIANGKLAIRELGGAVAVFTTTGRPLATIQANAASIALTANRVVVRTRDRRLVAFGLRGGLVHSWPLAAANWTAGLAAYGRYAVYLGANKAVHTVLLSSGADRVVARAGSGWFYDGISLQAPGAVAPLTVQKGKHFVVTLRFLPIARLKAAFR
jgi:hypothetical protein